jgi:hypothetical protein
MFLNDYHCKELKEVPRCGCSSNHCSCCVATIYFKDGAIFQDFPSNFLMVYCLEISRQNLIIMVS